jgi:ADP-ribose pyrophosphatase YjhB (NUDIX family)
MAERHKPRTASYLILRKDDEILLMKRKNTGFKDGMYSLVAGHVDEGENFREAMTREAREEVGIELEKEELDTTTVLHRRSQGAVYVDIFFVAEDWKGEPTNEEPEKCAELKWAKIDELPEDTIDYVKKVIDEMEEGMEYQEIGWEG